MINCRLFSLYKLVAASLVLLVLVHHISNGRRQNALAMFHGPPVVPYLVFFDGLDKYAIDAPLLKDKYITERVRLESSSQRDFLFLKKYLENILDVPQDTFDKLKASHTAFVNEFITRLEQQGVDTFGLLRHTHPEWDAYQASKGFVLVGGGKYSWLSYLVVKQLRETGNTLPIEIFIPSEQEYEKLFCEEVLPRYNARCNVLDPSLADTITKKLNIGGFQYKMLAILTSRFNNVLYMDSDLFLARNVEYLFDSEVYREKGLILWPDNWARTTNPKFHDIASHPVFENKIAYSQYDRARAEASNSPLKSLSDYTFDNSNFHDFQGALPDPSSEAGVMLINKTSHLRTMLLALYYNVYGPDFYYPLLTQGGAGEGDKETFIAAATVMDQPYFQTRRQFKWVGYHNQDEQHFTAKALGHYDPLEKTPDTQIIFMHCSYPKYYTDWFYNNHDLIYKDEKTHIRMYGDVYENLGYDLDLRLQQFFVQGACKEYYNDGKAIDSDVLEIDEYAGHFLDYIGGDLENNHKRCTEVYIPHLQWLKETTQYGATT